MNLTDIRLLFHLPITSIACFFALQPNTEQNKNMAMIHVRFQLGTHWDSNSSTQQLTVNTSMVCLHTNLYVCMHSCLHVCMCLSHIERNHSMNIFHSSSVSPSKGTASVSIWMLLGSLLPTQPMGVRLKEGRQSMSCWYTTGGSGSSLVDSASGSWNFRNWLAFSNPPKGMAHLAEKGERVIKDPVSRKASIESGLEYLLKLFHLGKSLCWMGPGIPAFRVAIRFSSPFMAFSHGDTYVFIALMCFLPASPLPPVMKTSVAGAYDTLDKDSKHKEFKHQTEKLSFAALCQWKFQSCFS